MRHHLNRKHYPTHPIVPDAIAMNDAVLLQAEGLAFRYSNERGVRGIDLALRRGEILGLLGLNGAGKSTTLRLLAGTLLPTAGSVSVNGKMLRPGLPGGRDRLGFLPETAPLYPELTVDEQLLFSARLYGLASKPARRAAAEARQRCGLDPFARRRVLALSQGMRRRLGIAQAIVHRPSVVLLDEPTVALDPVQIVQVRALIQDLARDSAVVLSSHLLNEVESVCTRVAVLHEGRLVHEQPLPDTTADGEIVLGLQYDPGLAAVTAAAQPAPVIAIGPGRYLIQGDRELAMSLAQRAVEQQWGVRELTPHAQTLERKFIALTRDDQASDS